MGMAPPDSHPRTSVSHRASLAWHSLGVLSVAGFAAVMAAMFWPADRAMLLSLTGERSHGLFLSEEEWHGLYFGERRIGHGMTRLREEGGRLHVEQGLHLRLLIAGQARRIDNRLRLALAPDLGLQELDFEAEVSGMGISARGRLENGRLVATVSLGPEALRFEYPVPARLVLEPLLLRRLAREDLSAGRRYRTEVFDPRSLAQKEIEIEVVALEALPGPSGLRPAVHLRRQQSGIVLDTWIDGEGRVLREESSLGLRSLREDRSTAEAEPESLPELDSAALQGLLPALPGTP